MKRVVKILAFFCLSFFVGTMAYAQDAPVYEQYIFDNSLMNPAFVGLVDQIQIKAAHRQQWIGFGAKQTPNTSFLLFRSRLRGRDGGLGGFIYSDRNGVNSQTGLQFNGSFQFLLRTKRTTKTVLSFGFGATVYMHTHDESQFYGDAYDPIIDYTKKNYFGYDANFGVLLTHAGLIAGISCNNLLQWTSRVYNLNYEFAPHINMNVHVGKAFWVAQRIQIAPLVIFKTNFSSMNQMDMGFKFKLFSNNNNSVKTTFTKYETEFHACLIYKQTLDSGNCNPLCISPMVSLVFKGFTVSYLCDIGLTSLQRYHFGTHQIALGYRFYRDKFAALGKHNEASVAYDF
ncbi:MAG: PorP/SprF family type IX secretion system membrane protein [Bacteroidales bacterium]|nr:PorP/SprF family type IX secretion system membrane protein [Bacteroidales bacterium]